MFCRQIIANHGKSYFISIFILSSHLFILSPRGFPRALRRTSLTRLKSWSPSAGDVRNAHSMPGFAQFSHKAVVHRCSVPWLHGLPWLGSILATSSARFGRSVTLLLSSSFVQVSPHPNAMRAERWLCICLVAAGKKSRPWPGLAAVLEDRVAAKDNVAKLQMFSGS